MPMFKNEYPYTNIHEINLDWIIKNVEEIRALVDKYIINYEQITFADPISWEYAVAYPMHTIVLEGAGLRAHAASQHAGQRGPGF